MFAFDVTKVNFIRRYWLVLFVPLIVSRIDEALVDEHRITGLNAMYFEDLFFVCFDAEFLCVDDILISYMQWLWTRSGDPLSSY